MHSAAAQDVRRCVRADGSVVYTDGRCSDAQNEKQPAAPASPAVTPGLPGVGSHSYVAMPPSCSRTPDDLLYGVRSAIDMRDTNQLAKYYHWLNVSDTQAEQLMDRLEKLVNSPLMDIQLMYPAEPEAASHSTAMNAVGPKTAETKSWRMIQRLPPDRRAPYALKLMQYQSSTSSRRHAVRYSGCSAISTAGGCATDQWNCRMATAPPCSRGAMLTCQPYSSHRRRTIDRPMPPPVVLPTLEPR